MARMKPGQSSMACILALLQMLSGGALGPCMLCVHSDGSARYEWSGAPCCGDDCVNEDSDAGNREGNWEGNREGQAALTKAPCCDCVDVPAPTQPAIVKASPVPSDRMIAHAPVAAIWTIPWHSLEPSASGRGALPPGHAPPRLHLSSVILRV